ncbi:mCG1027879 [Mus musculus]|nr:mCG1027879 [Mus musculus]
MPQSFSTIAAGCSQPTPLCYTVQFKGSSSRLSLSALEQRDDCLSVAKEGLLLLSDSEQQRRLEGGLLCHQPQGGDPRVHISIPRGTKRLPGPKE